MSRPGLGYETFRSRSRTEWMMRLGEPGSPPILFVPPLFEEQNRLRWLLAAAMRRLAGEGHGCWLPDLGGTGESETRLAAIGWEDWRHDVASAFDHVASRSGRRPLIASFRGGTLIDDEPEASGWWRLAPVSGRALVRDMVRAGLAGVEWAGYTPAETLVASLTEALPSEAPRLRTVRLASDPGPADARLAGPALWRRSEPGRSEELADGIAADLGAWANACAV